MLVACWSVKGGVGTTVVAASLALLLARRGPGVVLADLAGDGPAVLGMPEPDSPGLAGWLAAGDDVPADGLARLEVQAAPSLALAAPGPRAARARSGRRAGLAARPRATTGRRRLRDDRAGGSRRSWRRPAVHPRHPAVLSGAAASDGIASSAVRGRGDP